MKAQTATAIFDQIEILAQIKRSLTDKALWQNINCQIDKLNKTLGI